MTPIAKKQDLTTGILTIKFQLRNLKPSDCRLERDMIYYVDDHRQLLLNIFYHFPRLIKTKKGFKIDSISCFLLLLFFIMIVLR